MLSTSYAIVSTITAIVVAQVIKPLLHLFFTGQWDWHLILSSGGFPSSHTAGVTACCFAVGLSENFSSNLFAVTFVFALIIAYDAMNVRYYAGQNIQITRQLIKDITELSQIKLDDPIYFTKMKDVLGHKGFEVGGGIILGIGVSAFLFLFA